jgi:hypothetical protein
VGMAGLYVRVCIGKVKAHYLVCRNLCNMVAKDGSSTSHFPCDASCARREYSTCSSVIAETS